MDLWESYKSSVFLCHQPLGDQISFAIISAGNPQGQLLGAASNLALDSQLEHELKQTQLPCRRLIGASPDLTFQESSWAVLCDKAQALELAYRYAQNAIYWVEAGQLYLVPALLRQNEGYLGAYRPRQIVLRD